MVDSFLKYLQFEKRYSPRTIVSYQTDLSQFTDFVQHTFESRAQDANYGMIRSWIIQLSENQLDPASINRKIACLRSFYKFLLRQQTIGKNPMVKVRVLKTPKKLPHFVNESDLNAVLDKEEIPTTHDELRNRLMVELFYATGMRLSELIQLKDGDFNFNDRSVKVLGKRNKERVIPFTASLVPMLENYKQVRNRDIERKDTGIFFVNKKGVKLSPVTVNRIVKAYLMGTPVEKKSPHVLRHTYATHLLNNGAEINAVKDLLGHTSLAATQVYTHNTIDKLKKIFDKAHPRSGSGS
jgi:integrase/recombinase XerC